MFWESQMFKIQILIFLSKYFRPITCTFRSRATHAPIAWRGDLIGWIKASEPEGGRRGFEERHLFQNCLKLLFSMSTTFLGTEMPRLIYSPKMRMPSFLKYCTHKDVLRVSTT
jgi:hypothetical protein